NTVKQTLFTDKGLIYTRVKWSEWKPWQRLMTEEEVNKKLDPILALAKAGTKNGLFKFTPSKGVLPSRDLLDVGSFSSLANGRCALDGSHDGFPIYKYAYYSIPVQDNIKRYTNAPPIDTDLWFIIVRICLDNNSMQTSFHDVLVGYLADPNNLNSIEWYRNWCNPPAGIGWRGWSK